jgi:hypothetical protein
VESGDGALTIVGCLVPSGAPDSAGAQLSNDPPPRFTLVDAATSRSYSLVADNSRLDDLQRFANSKVEVAGLIVASTGTGTTGEVGAAAAPVGAAPGDVRRMRVKDVRQLEPKCASAKKD